MKFILFIILTGMMLPLMFQGILSLMILCRYPFMSEEEKNQCAPILPEAFMCLAFIGAGIAIAVNK